jgi:NitT/TauT family transport system substrate-binding protein
MDVPPRSSFLAASFALTVASATRPVRAQALSPLRVGATPNDTYAQSYFAQDAGFFTRAGLAVELQTLNNGAAVSAAVAAGALDVGVSTPVQIANAVSRGVPFVFVAAGALETPKVPVGLVCVAKNGPIRTAKDLEGKAVAVNALKTLSEVGLDLWLSVNGADVAKIHAVEMVFSEMGASIERGTIAGACISEPALSIALKTQSVRSLADPYSAIAPQFLISGWFATRDFVAKSPDLVKKFQTAMSETSRWANDHHSESGTILAKYTKMDVAIIHGMGRCPFADRLLAADIQPQLDVAAKFAIIPKPRSASDLIVH